MARHDWIYDLDVLPDLPEKWEWRNTYGPDGFSSTPHYGAAAVRTAIVDGIKTTVQIVMVSNHGDGSVMSTGDFAPLSVVEAVIEMAHEMGIDKPSEGG